MDTGASPGQQDTILATQEHCAYCFDVLAAHFSRATQEPVALFAEHTCPLFVSWKKAGRPEGKLRGCTGTLEATSLRRGLKDFALTSALRDRRFRPVSQAEVASLACTVSLLKDYETAGAWDDWTVGVHGIVITFADPATGQRRTATFLPEVAAHEGWTQRQAVDALIRKAGCTGPPSDALRASLRVVRYRSTACTLSHAALLEARRGPPGAERGAPGIAAAVGGTSEHVAPDGLPGVAVPA